MSALGHLAFLLLGIAFAFVLAAVVALSRHALAPAASGDAPAADASQGQAGPTGDWIPIRSTAPGDLIAAARQSTLFRQADAGVVTSDGNGDHMRDLSRPGTPVLVRALRPAGASASQYPDFYVVPILDTGGAATDAAELALNPAHTAIHVIAIVTYSQPHAHGAIARMNAGAALAAVRDQHHAAALSGIAPKLVYFPGDAAAQETGQVTWDGGGQFPADPIWVVRGADGHDHVVGANGRAYFPSQLPMQQGG